MELELDAGAAGTVGEGQGEKGMELELDAGAAGAVGEMQVKGESGWLCRTSYFIL